MNHSGISKNLFTTKQSIRDKNTKNFIYSMLCKSNAEKLVTFFQLLVSQNLSIKTHFGDTG